MKSGVLKYELDFKDGIWGIWTETYNFNSLAELDFMAHIPFVRIDGVVLHSFLRKPVSRQKLVEQMPKKRKFLTFPVGLQLDKNKNEIVWVGHLGCFHDNRARENLLSAGYPPNLIVAVCSNVDTGENILLALHVKEDMICPVTDCCDS